MNSVRVEPNFSVKATTTKPAISRETAARRAIQGDQRIAAIAGASWKPSVG
jgi:hypothetical protein